MRISPSRPAAVAVATAGLPLAATTVADGLGFPTAAFYTFLLGVPVSAVIGLATFGRLVDEADGRDAGTRPGGAGARAVLERVQIFLWALLVAVFLLGAAARSTAAFDGDASGLAKAALGLGLGILALQALLALAPVRR